MNEPNIIVKDWKKIKKFFSPMKEGFTNLLVFMLRWMISVLIASLITDASTINTMLFFLVAVGVYTALFIFHKTYELEKWLTKQK
jgi:membrane protein YdbS with pleckstrin-like domain